MNAKHEQPAGPHTADAIAQRTTDRRTRDDARRIAAAWKDDKKRIKELEEFIGLIANPKSWVSQNGEIVWNEFSGNEFFTEHCMNMAEGLLKQAVTK